MYPGYEQYWGAILANPNGVLPFTGRVATNGEIEYARFAQKRGIVSRDFVAAVLAVDWVKAAWEKYAS
jgi:hypothetical protein